MTFDLLAEACTICLVASEPFAARLVAPVGFLGFLLISLQPGESAPGEETAAVREMILDLLIR